MKKIVHKNIIEVKKLLIDELTGRIYLVMECFEGDEMFEYISNCGSYSEEKAKDLFKQLLEGIHFLHKKGIVHRDLKPNNILVSKDGKILKITDFNVAKFCDDYQNYDDFKKNNYEMNTYTGTIAFRAPEMFEKLSYSESIDIWAAGCVLYTMLSGEQPFYSEYITDLIILIEKCEYNFDDKGWDLVSKAGKDLIKNLIVKDPKKRLAPKIALKHIWFEDKNENYNSKTKTRNQIQSNLKKNKRRLTKTNLVFDMNKRNSFNRGLSKSKGFDIFIKRVNKHEFHEDDDSCDDYNVNDSYESFNSEEFDIENNVIKENSKEGFSESGNNQKFESGNNHNQFESEKDFKDLSKNNLDSSVDLKKKKKLIHKGNKKNIKNINGNHSKKKYIEKSFKNNDINEIVLKKNSQKKKIDEDNKNDRINNNEINDFLDLQKKKISHVDIEKILNSK